MPDCPNCKRYYFGNPDLCPNCNYSFQYKRVITSKEKQSIAAQKRQEQTRAQEHATEQHNNRIDLHIKSEHEEKQLREEIETSRYATYLQNPRYEYKTEYLSDDSNGTLPKIDLDQILYRYASEGWRLHTIFTNEAGKNAGSIGIGGIGIGSNATMETTILVFERCIKPATYGEKP